MFLLLPVTWLLMGLVVSVGYTLMLTPPELRGLRRVGWGTVLGLFGGLAGYGLALGIGAVAPNSIALVFAAVVAGCVMALFSTRELRHH